MKRRRGNILGKMEGNKWKIRERGKILRKGDITAGADENLLSLRESAFFPPCSNIKKTYTHRRRTFRFDPMICPCLSNFGFIFTRESESSDWTGLNR